MKIIKKAVLKISIVFLFLFLLSPLLLNAQVVSSTSDKYSDSQARMEKQTTAFFGESGYSGSSADSILGSVIKTVLSLLGIVFVILIIFSGYQWMMAGGNEEQVSKAKDRIRDAVIGVIIVVLAYAITAFVFKNLPGGSGGVTEGGTTGTKTN